MLVASCGILPAQEPGGAAADPFVRKVGADPVEVPADPGGDGPKQVSICFEAFSLESGDAAALLRAGLDGKTLYEKVVQKVGEKSALQESLIVARTRSGEKAMVEGVSEQIYPTRFEPPYGGPPLPSAPAARQQTEQSLQQQQMDGRVPGGSAPAVPRNFETRSVGWSFEIFPTIGMNNKVIDLRFIPSRTVKAGNSSHGHGLAQVESPLFETQHIDTAVTVNAGTPFFAGTFNRPAEAQFEPATAKRVWLAFVTPTIVTAECTVLH
ncbi:MAG: hypothetical protein JWO82_432 [Akkermansiaceae bacterium]|nr:hypothetical protein [Akkermansiaceae bacterium]